MRTSKTIKLAPALAGLGVLGVSGSGTGSVSEIGIRIGRQVPVEHLLEPFLQVGVERQHQVAAGPRRPHQFRADDLAPPIPDDPASAAESVQVVVVHPLQAHPPPAVADFVCRRITPRESSLSLLGFLGGQRLSHADEMRRQLVLRIIPPGEDVDFKPRIEFGMRFDLRDGGQGNPREQRMTILLFPDDERIANLPGRRRGDRLRKQIPQPPPRGLARPLLRNCGRHLPLSAAFFHQGDDAFHPALDFRPFLCKLSEGTPCELGEATPHRFAIFQNLPLDLGDPLGVSPFVPRKPRESLGFEPRGIGRFFQPAVMHLDRELLPICREHPPIRGQQPPIPAGHGFVTRIGLLERFREPLRRRGLQISDASADDDQRQKHQARKPGQPQRRPRIGFPTPVPRFGSRLREHIRQTIQHANVSRRGCDDRKSRARSKRSDDISIQSR